MSGTHILLAVFLVAGTAFAQGGWFNDWLNGQYILRNLIEYQLIIINS